MTTVITTVSEMENAREALTTVVGLVPTMGYLHEGHLSLVRRCTTENEVTIVSIFVNPTQFGPNEDLAQYPRNETQDLQLLEDAGVDIVFMPSEEEMYPPGFDQWVEIEGPVVERLEGKHRPGHLRGVTTVVARLLRVIRPDRVYFGQKDAQQLRAIRRMVWDLDLPVSVVGMPIVRDPDGLALSSRNVYLSRTERHAALVLSRALKQAEDMVRAGETDAKKIRDRVQLTLTSEPIVQMDYVSISDEGTLEEIEKLEGRALLLLAARVGTTRLIDNVELAPPQ